MDRGDLEREQDIEELRSIALAQHAQIQALIEVVAAKSREVERLRGSAGDLQLTLKMLAELQAKAKATAEKIEKAKPKETSERKPRSSTGQHHNHSCLSSNASSRSTTPIAHAHRAAGTFSR